MNDRTIVRPEWLGVLRRYVLVVAPVSLGWEVAHMPLYTLWETGTPGEIALAALHCTGGDVLIALGALGAALLLVGSDRWPERGYGSVAAVAVMLGIGYTVLSEWVNVDVRKAWVYRDLMPVIPVIGTGLSPVAQWVAIPTFALWRARRLPASHRGRSR